MLKRLTEIQKIIGVIALTLLVVFMAYQFSFKQTLALKSEFDSKKDMVENVDQIKTQINFYEESLSKNSFELKTDESALQNSILEHFTSFCESNKEALNLTITEVYPVHKFEFEDKAVRTCSFSVKGTFKDLLQLNANFEKTLRNAELSSVEYQLSEKKRKKELTATYHIQNISEI